MCRKENLLNINYLYVHTIYEMGREYIHFICCVIQEHFETLQKEYIKLIR